jgi:DNA polymerase-1
VGIEVFDTTDETLARYDHPLTQRLRDYRYAKWLEGSYGVTFLRHCQDGRVHARWHQTGNVAGRSSCDHPNLQQIPRDPRFRRCFCAPEGQVIIKADYSAIHLRIAAKIANDEVMLSAFKAGKDLHRITAASLLSKPESDVTRQDRQLAKAVAFGLLYGMGAKGLRDYARQSYGVEMTTDEAKQHREKFFETYKGLAFWHRKTQRQKASQVGTETRTLAGRRRLIDKKTPIMHRLNSPVLGTEGDGAKRALALLWERRADAPFAFPIAFIHDEIVVEALAADADAVASWLRQAMIDGIGPLIDPVPCEVEVVIARTWGGDS